MIYIENYPIYIGIEINTKAETKLLKTVNDAGKTAHWLNKTKNIRFHNIAKDWWKLEFPQIENLISSILGILYLLL